MSKTFVGRASTVGWRVTEFTWFGRKETEVCCKDVRVLHYIQAGDRRTLTLPVVMSVPSGDSIALSETGYLARLIDCSSEDEVRAYQTLRYECFVLQKGWVDANPTHPGRETDRYDSCCYHLGVFQGSHLVAYLRALPWQADPGFMVEHEFRDLIPDDVAKNLRQERTVEISRLVVAPPPGSGRSEMVVLAELLFKLVYCVGKCLGWAAYYIVLEEAWLRVLNRRFHLPFAPIGVPHIYPDGTKTLAASATCQDLEQTMLETSPEKHSWYRQDMTQK